MRHPVFAVFENTSDDWSDLPINYRESSLYTADKDVEGMECSVDRQEDKEVDDRDDNNRTQTDLGTMPADSASLESGSTESTTQVMKQLPPKRKTSQKHVANIPRATLQQLKELTYLSQDTDTLTEVTKELKSLISKLSATVP